MLDLAALQRADSFWRVSVSLTDALLLVQAQAPELVREIVDGMLDERWRRKTTACLARRRQCGPRTFFGG